MTPLDERFSLYLSVTKAPDGSLRGAYRNPEFNFTGRAPWFRVAIDGEALAFTDSATGRVRYRQAYDANQRTILMDFGAPIWLTPREREHAVGYLPRTPGMAEYEYRPPVPAGDGWRTARASEVGLREDSLRALVRRIVAVDPAAANAPRIHSVLVARRGRLVLEEYFFGYSADRPHDLRSASKTLTSLMAGIAIDQGKQRP